MFIKYSLCSLKIYETLEDLAQLHFPAQVITNFLRFQIMNDKSRVLLYANAINPMQFTCKCLFIAVSFKVKCKHP